jgi:hypothetical protein
MAMQRFRFGVLPIPPSEYSPEHMRQAFRILELYFNQLDSTTPLAIEGLQLLNLPTSGYGLREGTVFRVGEDLKVVTLNNAYTFGVPASGSLGTVSVTIVP